jgi:polyribonucleotide nucleotidyltransferase
MKEYKQNFKIAGKDVEVSTGLIAEQSHGAIMLKMGGTVLFAAATVDDRDTDLDYFPLTVEYIERMYARGAISNSRFRKREGLPSDEATIKAREVDHSIRSLFPKSFKKAVSVILTVLAYDGENDPQALTVLGASLALIQSGVPFAGPCSSVIVCVDDKNKLIINPSAEDRETFAGEFIVSGVDGRVLSFEGWGKELPEDVMGTILDEADKEIRSINAEQVKFQSAITPTLDIDASIYAKEPVSKELITSVSDKFSKEIESALFNDKVERNDRMREVSAKIKTEMESEDVDSSDISAAIDYVARSIVRKAILKDGKRVTDRGLEEIRPLSASIDILPTVHGSALFNRGLTQSLSIVTLAPKSSELLIDDMEGEDTKTFMHHYNFPPYSVGEAGRFRYHPGRREVGHGAIGENALMNMIPSTSEFPYTIRVVSEIMSSNGSTSMAATCASSLALMAAGVPMKEQVAGIGVGLVTDDSDESNYKLLLDIEGMEDFYGDMDFKVCGTKNGITAIQYENKLQGVPLDILKEAFKLAQKGRMQLLEVMNATIKVSRDDVPENAPKVETVQIQTDQIGELIGPGGKNIKELVEQSKKISKVEADINIDDDGTVTISAINDAQMTFIKNSIEKMFEKPEVGQIYDGVVGKIMEFGAFIDVSRSLSGLCHISEMSDEYVKDPKSIVKEGQKVRVKLLKIDEKGRINFTMKGVEQPA